MSDTLLSFENYLKIKTVSSSTIHNYISDVRIFLKWFNSLNMYKRKNSLNFDNFEDLKSITKNYIKLYINYLKHKNISNNIINRKLSSLRKFFEFLVEKHFINQNPAKSIVNLPNYQTEDLLNIVKKELIKREFDQNTIHCYLSDLRHFLKWIYKKNSMY